MLALFPNVTKIVFFFIGTHSNSPTVLNLTCKIKEAINEFGGLMRLVMSVLQMFAGKVCFFYFGQVVDFYFAEFHLFYQKITVHGETSFIYNTYL